MTAENWRKMRWVLGNEIFWVMSTLTVWWLCEHGNFGNVDVTSGVV